MNKYESGGYPDETRIEKNNYQETKNESENNLSLEELAEKYNELYEKFGTWTEKVPKAVEIREKIKTEQEMLIKETKSLDELSSVLDRIDKLKLDILRTFVGGRHQDGKMPELYYMGRLLEHINKVKKGDLSAVQYITNTFGLRDKVNELLNSEKEKENICPQCGFVGKSGANFCRKCGAKL